MIGTALIATVGYGLTLVFAFYLVSALLQAAGLQRLTVESKKLAGEVAFFCAALALGFATLTRYLTGI